MGIKNTEKEFRGTVVRIELMNRYAQRQHKFPSLEFDIDRPSAYLFGIALSFGSTL